MNGVDKIGGQGIAPPTKATPTQQDKGKFGSFLKQAFNDANQAQIKADEAVNTNLEGKTGIQESMMALQEADLSMRFMLQVRNKVLDAYREIMRMPF